jgi:hypothetical protein
MSSDTLKRLRAWAHRNGLGEFVTAAVTAFPQADERGIREAIVELRLSNRKHGGA